jgi:hypothetical protein
MMTRTIETKCALPARYAFELLHEIPGAGQTVVYHAPNDRQAGRDGLWVRVAPLDGEPWIGMFAFGGVGSETIAGVYTCPDPMRICVVADGEGYLVRVDQPTKADPAKLVGITGVLQVSNPGLLIMANPWDVCAYDNHGVCWVADSVGVDGIKLLDADERFLRLSIVDDEGETYVRRIDLVTGSVAPIFDA